MWVGNPTDWTSEVMAGNRSGHALTSLIAKVNKVIDTLGIINMLYPVVGRCDWYLKGNGVMGLINNGDDEIVWANTKSDLKRFVKLRETRSLGRYAVSAEVGQGYSGLLLRRVGECEYDPCARIHTTFEKMWVPERKIGGTHRPYWTIGAIDRINNIMSTTQGQKAWEVHMKVYRDKMAYAGDFMTELMRAHAEIKIDLDSLSAIDKDVLENPDKIHYKYDESDVTPRILDEVCSKIPLGAVENIVKRYYKGHVL